MINKNEFQNIRRYVEGRMSPNESGQFEAEIVRDDFLADAVEGFKTDNGAFDDMPKLSQSSFSWLYILGAFSVVLLFAWLPSEPEMAFGDDMQVVEMTPIIEELPIENRQSELTIAPLISEKTEEENTIEQVTNIEVDIPLELNDADLSETPLFIEAYMKPIEASEIEAPANKEIQDNTDIIYIQDLKVVSFSQAKTVAHFENKQHENHLPAAFEDSAPPTSPLQARLAQRLTKINYSERLEQALIAIGNADYAKASKLINQLNRDFGQTVNHNFYLGLCAYHLGDYSTSNEIFKSVEADIIQSFRQEAMWYRALSLQKLEMQVESLEIFEEIYEANGHYAPMAASRIIVLRE